MLVPHLWIQIITDRKYFFKIPENSKKQKFNLSLAGNYLHSIYLVLGIVSNLEVI